ncbi:MAG: EAL domain-containing protein [Leptolyngbyaceae cyanobacterium T60_A2020_046]|nr:EAL domain-containing protein [Leptolyngbyaceae cyanobacterium T60_A2020_046]
MRSPLARFQRWFHTPSLRLVLVVPFVIQIVLAIALTGTLALYYSQSAVRTVSVDLRQEISDRIVDHLTNYLVVPHRVNRLNLKSVQDQTLDLSNLERLEQHFWSQAQEFEVVDYIFYGNVDGEFAGGGWPMGRDRPMQIHRVRRSDPQNLQFFNTNAEGKPVELILETPDFNVPQRPWFTAAVEARQATWGEIFTFQAFPAMALPASVPVFDSRGQLQGVFGNNFFLTRISDFLGSLKVGKSGEVFIVEHNGLLVAGSTLKQPFTVKGGQTERIHISTLEDSPIRWAEAAILEQIGPLESIERSHDITFQHGGDRYLLRITAFHDNYGLDWLIGIILPEADFMQPIFQYRQVILWLCLGALLTSLGIGLYTARLILRPIQRLDSAASRVASGQFQHHLPDSGLQELDRLSAAFSGMATQLRNSFDALHRQAYHDALTNLPNRAALIETLERSIERARRDPDYRFAVLFLDLDNFKLINDSLGHLIGDKLLIAIAKRLRSAIPKAITLTRFGGDEFVLVQPEIQSVVDATQFVQRLFQVLEYPLEVNDREIFVTASLGIVLSTHGAQSPFEFLRSADTALYRAKAEGKARYEVFNVEMYADMARYFQLETALRQSIHAQSLTLAFQPIVQLDTQTIVGFEALCRWHHPVLGDVPPSQFIAIAEETGQIVALERWVLHQSCVQMRLWQQQFSQMKLDFISVNLSPLHVMHPHFLEHIEQVIQATGINRRYLKLEVTESLMMQNPDLVRIRLKRLRDSGIRLSIDDFGTGYSSLSYLHQFPFESLKIDRSFIQRLTSHSADHSIVQAIVMMAHSFHLDVIAEGIESVHQVNWLHQVGCHYGQGYLFSPPVSAIAATQILRVMQPATKPPEPSS